MLWNVSSRIRIMTWNNAQTGVVTVCNVLKTYFLESVPMAHLRQIWVGLLRYKHSVSCDVPVSPDGCSPHKAAPLKLPATVSRNANGVTNVQMQW